MKSVILIILLLISAYIPAISGEGKEEKKDAISIELLVVDAKTDEPIPAAKIKITQNNKEAYTDFDGIAEIKDLTQGEYDIEITFISYQKQLFKAFKLENTNTQLLVKLQP